MQAAHPILQLTPNERNIIDAYTKPGQNLSYFWAFWGAHAYSGPEKLNDRESAFAKMVHQLALIGAGSRIAENLFDEQVRQAIERQIEEKIVAEHDENRKKLIRNELDRYRVCSREYERYLQFGDFEPASFNKKLWYDVIGDFIATGVGFGEGVVAAVPLALAVASCGFYALAIPVFLVTFICGVVANRYLLLQPCTEITEDAAEFKINKNEAGDNLGWIKYIANNFALLLAVLGTGVVFASVFYREFTVIMQQFSFALSPFCWQFVFPIAQMLGVGIGILELVGISSLLHRGNSKLIKDPEKNLLGPIKAYFQKRFYVPLANIRQEFPRLIYSFVATAVSAAIMVFYMSLIFTFFSGVVPGLLVHLPIALTTAVILGKVAAGINCFTTFKAFTLPLGNLVRDTLLDQLFLPILLAVPAFSLTALKIIFFSFWKEGIVGAKQQLAHTWNWVNETSAWLASSEKQQEPEAVSLIGSTDGARRLSVVPSDEVVSSEDGLPYEKLETCYMEQKGRVGWLMNLVLFINGAGQSLLFIDSTFTALSIFGGLVQGIRSYAMNLLGFKETFDNDTHYTVFKRERDRSPVQADIPLSSMPVMTGA